jgi:hypothetical protein
MVSMLIEGEIRLGIWSGHASTTVRQAGPEKKDPPSVHILTDRGRAGAIDAHVGFKIEQINNGAISRTEKKMRRCLTFIAALVSLCGRGALGQRDAIPNKKAA